MGALSDEVWVFGEEITEGMSREIAYAKELGKSVRMISESRKMISRLLAAIRESVAFGVNSKNAQDDSCGNE